MWKRQGRPRLEEIDEVERNDPTSSFCDKHTPIQIDYAWKWFSYHAQQRLTAFHYFLLVIALLTTGYVTALGSGFIIVERVLCAVGVLISLSFLFLDVRNEELVNDGRAALRKLERAIDITIHRADYKRQEIRFSPFRKQPGWAGLPEVRTWHKHGFWLRVIEGLAAGIFVAALAFSFYRSTSPSSDAAQAIAALKRAAVGTVVESEHRAMDLDDCLKVFSRSDGCECLVGRLPAGIRFRQYLSLSLIGDPDLAKLSEPVRTLLGKIRSLSGVCFSE